MATLAGHTDCIYTIVPGREPQLFFSGAGDGMLVCWDLTDPENGQLIARVNNSVYSLHYLSEPNWLVVGHNYDGIHLIDVESRKEVASLKLTSAAIFDIQSYKELLFVATGEGELIVVNWPELRIVDRRKFANKSARTIAINPVERHIAAGFSDNHIRILHMGSLDEVQSLNAHTNSVFTLQYSPDFRYLLSGSRDAHLKVWDVENGYVQHESIVAHMYAINHIAYSPSGRHLVTCSMDKSIKVWDAATFRLLKVIDRARHAGHGTSVNKLLWSSFQNQLVSASDDRSISVWDLSFN